MSVEAQAHVGREDAGLLPSGPDAATATRRAELLSLLVAATEGNGGAARSVFSGTLNDQPDMYWEGALVIVDVERQELLFATGGFGT